MLQNLIQYQGSFEVLLGQDLYDLTFYYKVFKAQLLAIAINYFVVLCWYRILHYKNITRCYVRNKSVWSQINRVDSFQGDCRLQLFVVFGKKYLRKRCLYNLALFQTTCSLLFSQI